MLKKNKILVGCLSLLLVLSVGYALFSEQVTINGTATAKGSFDIETTCITNVTPDFLYELGFEDDSKDGETVAEMYRSHGYKDESCTVNGDTVTYSVGLGYPTATKWSFVKMTNEGSIPAYFDFYSVIEQHIKNIVKKYDNQNNYIGTITTGDEFNPFIGMAVMYLVAQNTEGMHFNFYEDDEGFIEKFADINEETDEVKIILKPGESLYIPLIAEWNDGYNENNVKYEATGTFKIDWIQYTE